jgi:hypothetical protein
VRLLAVLAAARVAADSVDFRILGPLEVCW